MQYFYATEDDKLRNFILSSTDGKKRSLIDLMNKFKYKIKVSQIKNIPGNDNQKSAD